MKSIQNHFVTNVLLVIFGNPFFFLDVKTYIYVYIKRLGIQIRFSYINVNVYVTAIHHM